VPDPLRVVVVGCGDIATTGHLPAIARSQDAALVGVVDRDPEQGTRASQAYAVPVLAGIEEAHGAGAGAVVIATPPEISPGLTRQAIGLGLDVLCEKPMAVDLASAEAVLALTERSASIVQIGLKNRFSPLVRATRGWIETGRIGSPVAFTLGGFDEAHDPDDVLHTSRIGHFLDTAPSFVHEGAHFADHVAYLSGSTPTSVRAVGVRSRPELPSENFVSALVGYANGDVARLEIGWQLPASPVGEFRVLGPDGVAIVDRPGGTATLHTRSGTEVVRLEGAWNDVCFDAQLAHFIACVRARVEPETSTRVGLDSLRLGVAVAQAMRSGETVSWP